MPAQWRDESAARDVFDPAPLPVVWRAGRELADHPENIGGDVPGATTSPGWPRRSAPCRTAGCSWAGCGAVVLLVSASGRWVVTRVGLALTGRLPWAAAEFPREAHRAGVLRRVGGVHQFRHVRLRVEPTRLVVSWHGRSRGFAPREVGGLEIRPVDAGTCCLRVRTRARIRPVGDDGWLVVWQLGATARQHPHLERALARFTRSAGLHVARSG